MKNQLNVRNEIQKRILEDELIGQFSDGYWENSRKHGWQWRYFTQAEILVNENQVGWKDHNPLYAPYNITSNSLLLIIGPRIYAIAKAAKLGVKSKGLKRLMTNVEYFFNTSNYKEEFKKWKKNPIIEIKKIYEDNYKYAKEEEENESKSTYWRNKIHEINEGLKEDGYSSIEEFEKALNEVDYSWKDFMNDLKDLKNIINNKKF